MKTVPAQTRRASIAVLLGQTVITTKWESAVRERLLERLSQLDCCSLSDALDSRSLSGVALGLVPLSGQRKIVGRVVTIKLGLDDGRTSERHLGTAAVEAAGEGSVIVVDHGARTNFAGWGGILTLAAKTRGVNGVIIDGASRDIAEARELDFAIYGRSSVPTTARGRVVELGWNVPIQVSGVEVLPGDLVVADANGVVFIPLGQAPQLITIAENIARKESLMAQAIRAGVPVSQVMGQSYEAMLKEVSE